MRDILYAIICHALMMLAVAGVAACKGVFRLPSIEVGWRHASISGVLEKVSAFFNDCEWSGPPMSFVVRGCAVSIMIVFRNLTEREKHFRQRREKNEKMLPSVSKSSWG